MELHSAVFIMIYTSQSKARSELSYLKTSDFKKAFEDFFLFFSKRKSLALWRNLICFHIAGHKRGVRHVYVIPRTAEKPGR